jgi:hypothetical protein
MTRAPNDPTPSDFNYARCTACAAKSKVSDYDRGANNTQSTASSASLPTMVEAHSPLDEAARVRSHVVNRRGGVDICPDHAKEPLT